MVENGDGDGEGGLCEGGGGVVDSTVDVALVDCGTSYYDGSGKTPATKQRMRRNKRNFWLLMGLLLLVIVVIVLVEEVARRNI